MGRICPILNHPLNDGVLVEDEAVVGFIQKRNIDFLPNELVCRSCKREVIKLYQKKKKKATALYKSLYHDGSISSLNKSSKASSIASERSLTRNELQQSSELINNNTTANSNTNNSSISIKQQNGNKSNSFKESNRSKNSSSLSKTSSSPTAASKVTENQNKQQQPNQRKTIPGEIGRNANVTVRKKTIRDFLTIQPPPSSTTTAATTRHIVASDEHDNSEVIRRLSQEPTTSSKAIVSTKAPVNSNKRPISAIVDDESDEDDERLSLNAYNGTPLPHIQPLPPKRKPVADRAISMARDIMDEYIKDITGG
ncbi:uncharacterized protein ACRADG_000907 [Cochliomyia hominivorax]